MNRVEEDIKVVEDIDHFDKLEEYNRRRTQMMNNNNPKYILRNHLAEEAIARAEVGDFEAVKSLLKVLEQPYEESDNESSKKYCQSAPEWSHKLKVSCSS